MYERTKEILDAVLKFEERSSKTRKIVNAKFLENENELHYIFRKTLDGFLILVMENLFGKYDGATEKFLYQLNLTVSYIRTHFVINNLIVDGDLIEAYTFIRKQFEKYTRINELDNKPIEKLRGKTPNVINLFGEAGKEKVKLLLYKGTKIVHSLFLGRDSYNQKRAKNSRLQEGKSNSE